MSEEIKSQRARYFNLNADGDTAIIRILHSSVNTIETAVVHSIKVDGKSKKIKCLGEKCPLCESKSYSSNRIFLHLFDYTDNTEKVWDRTDKLLPQLKALEESWAPLNSAVIRVTRKGNEFPQYTLDVLNPMNYQDVKKELIDVPLAKFYYLNRKFEEVDTFVKTGNFPPRESYLPKEEYLKLKKASSNGDTSTTSTSSQVETQTNKSSFFPTDDTLPF